MPRRKPDIVFTEPVQHHESPRKALYNSRRRKNVKRGFGLAAMIVGILGLLFFFWPHVDVPIGILGVILAAVALGIRTDGRDVGHHLATVGLWTSIASLVLAGLFFFLGAKKKKDESKLLEQKQAALVKSLSGVWASRTDADLTLEFTPGGNLIFSRLSPRVDESDEVGPQPLLEVAGLYQVDTTGMTIGVGSRSTRYTWEILPKGDLAIMAPSDRNIRLEIVGKWRKITTQKFGVDHEDASPELKKYLTQLDEYTARKKTLIKTLVRYTNERDGYIADLREYEDRNRPRDDNWRIIGGDLKAVDQYIGKISERVATIDRVIVKLQAIIRNQGRKEDIARLNMSENELIDLLARSHELAEELQPSGTPGFLTDAEVEKILESATQTD